MRNRDFDFWLRGVMWAAILTVAAIAAIVSFSHILGLALLYGQFGATARLLPISVDGTILVASVVLLHEARALRPGPWEAWGMLILGIGATLAANVGYGVAFGAVGALVSAWPAAALIGVVEVGMALMRRHAKANEAKAEAKPEEISPPEPEDEGPLGLDELAILYGRGEQAFAGSVQEFATPTIRDIRRELRVGQPRAERVQAHLGGIIRRRLDEEGAALGKQLA
jgi:hypothetical protein